MKALVIDDDLVLADVLSFTLRRAGFVVVTAQDGEAALDRWRQESPDLIILDLKLPKRDGLSVCQAIRAQSKVPIIILSVRSEDEDVVRGLELGADDYIAKPFSPSQLVARARAVLRRAGLQILPSSLSFGDFALDVQRRELSITNQPPIQLTQLECKLLETLLINREQVLPADTLISAVWGPAGGDKIMLKQLVHRLRRKIEATTPSSMTLETVPGVGYALVHRPT